MADWRKIGAVFMVAAVLAGCTQEDGPLSPGRDLTPGPETAQAALVCQVDVKAGSMACIPESPSLPAGVAGAVLGGQGEYVELEAANVAYDATHKIFSADVTVRNLLTQALGTADGATSHVDGVRVFFASPPVSAEGTITVVNADGTGTFSGASQPYFQYAQALTPGKVSLPRTWQFGVPGEVASFTFKVYVAALTANEEGIEPGLQFNARTISAGNSHSCGLTLGGAAYCWGAGGSGRLGNGGTDNATTPVSVQAPAGTKFVAISAGDAHTCAVTSTGAAYCWGYGAFGQLGNGGTVSATTPDSVRVPAGTKFVAISAGPAHTCGVISTGAAYCWGLGIHSQLGNGGAGPYATKPDSVWAPAGTNFVAISAAAEHTCGITSTGAAYCWGNGGSGRLGNGGGNKATPDSVRAPAGTKFVAIGAGGSHTCGVTYTGAAYCWGYGGNGRLGNDGTVAVTTPDSVWAPAGTKFVTISAGGAHTCGITSTGTAYCWGHEGNGRLGNDGTGDKSTPDSVRAPAGTKFVAISAGNQHTCGTTSTGAAYCWGDGRLGRLGNGETDVVTPTPSPVLNVMNFALLDPRIPASGAGILLPASTSFEAYAFAGRTGSAPAPLKDCVTTIPKEYG